MSCAQSDNKPAAVRRGGENYAELVATPHPDRLVLWPVEAAREDFHRRPMLDDYTLIKVWDALPTVNAVLLLPDRPWLEFKACLHLYRRKPGPGGS
jgi:hypothetical protein